MERTNKPKLSEQVRSKTNKPVKKEQEFEGNFNTVISTGSTLLDLAISGKRIRGGGIPGGILLEAFGPSQSGKTALLSEIAGNVLKQGGELQFHDPEARLDHEFASIFGMHIKKENYHTPDTVTQVFDKLREFEPENKKAGVVNGIFADSLAALSTDLEMNNKEGDKMGMRRAKEFSEELRKTCRILKQKNFLLACSNQIRVNADPNSHQKYTTPGGEAVKFYASIRLKFNPPTKVNKTIKIKGKEVKQVIGIITEIEVVKTVDAPYRKAPLYITYNYGIDDVRANLQYLKDFTKSTTYCLNGESLGVSMDDAIAKIEKDDLEQDLKESVIDLWEAIDAQFEVERKPKK